ncbi:MAG: outer membrane protein assembly factor BamD [Opitutales bacterium]|nr:outer membrane protein assembly factor BamD [Opitutales bacterium]
MAFGAMSSSCSVWQKVTTKGDKENKGSIVAEKKSKAPKTPVEKQKRLEDISYNKIYRSSDHDLKYRYAMRMFELNKFERAIAILDEVYPFYMNRPEADTLMFTQALCRFRKGQFEASSQLFDRFRKRFTYSPLLEEAEYHYAKGYYYMSPRPERDQTTTHIAMKALNDYLTRYPNTVHKEDVLKYIAELQQKIYDKELLNARVYFNVGHYKSAVFALKNILAIQPETTHREEIMYLIVKSGFELAENSVEELRLERYLDTIDSYYNFISEYPETKFKKDVEKIYKASQKFVKSTKKNNNSEDGNQEERSE